MMLTLFADASFCPDTGAAGYGAWAIKETWDRGRFFSGPINVKCKSSNDAELLGIVSAAYALEEQKAFHDVTSIMIQCDNVTALGFILQSIPNTRVRPIAGLRAPLLQGAPTGNKHNLKALKWFQETLAGKRVWLRHVKGHNTVENDGRSWVNTRCDEAARKHMVVRRAFLRRASNAAKHFEPLEIGEQL